MPNRDGSGPFGDGRPGRGLGNCATSRRTSMTPTSNRDYNNRGYASNGISILVEAVRYFLNRKSNNRR